VIKPEQILDEVIETTAWAMCDDINGEGCWDETPFRHRPMWRSAARAAIAAALNAWPGAYERTDDWCTPPDHNLILPLTQENNNGSD